MTEAEAAEIALLAAANAITSFTVYITFTFGYLAAAFFVGKQLTSRQVGVFNSLFVFSTASALFSLISNMRVYGVAVDQAGKLWPSGPLNQASFWNLYMGILLVAGIVASLYFMWSTRRNRSSS